MNNFLAVFRVEAKEREVCQPAQQQVIWQFLADTEYTEIFRNEILQEGDCCFVMIVTQGSRGER